MKQNFVIVLSVLIFICNVCQHVQGQNDVSLQFKFEGNVSSNSYQFEGENFKYTKGISGRALSLGHDKSFNTFTLNSQLVDGSGDFTIQFWVQVLSDKPTVLVSQKHYLDKSITSHKNEGWAFYTSGGTFAWSVGSGSKRLNYERENGNVMPVCDGEWHQLTMTYDKELLEVRLYYDGHNKAIYKVGFDFANDNPLVIGAKENKFDYKKSLLPQIEEGVLQLQALVDEFNSFGLGNLHDDEFLSLVTNPDDLFESKKNELDSAQIELIASSNLKRVKEIRKELLKNPYTVFQILELTELKPISKIYYLDNGKIHINGDVARSYTQQVQLFPSEFNIDDLTLLEKVLDSDEVLNSYAKYKNCSEFIFEEKVKILNVGDWNIWHGGIHYSVEKDNWDSRMRIVEMIKEKDLDLILLQETYSSGDFIAAELGYYYATASDWDYCFQGTNISVISRYPITEVFVPLEASFMNVGVKVALSKTQEIYAMSNWYGMSSFPAVYEFHQARFARADLIPIIFAGDFNAVPHTDGGKSPASVKLLENGFVDAYRSKHLDVKKYPGYTHRSNKRIDQVYFKGDGLHNMHTEIISTWDGGFPSDHFLIVSEFELE